jgi:phosphate butyryltransferase
MFRSFTDIETFVLSQKVKKTIVLAGAHTKDGLESVLYARKKGIADVKLIGDAQKTEAILRDLCVNPETVEIIHVSDGEIAARLACEMVAGGKADIPMKGSLLTSAFMRAILDRSFGYVAEKGLLSQVTVFEYLPENRLMLMSDCAVNIRPTYEEKCKILANAIEIAKDLGIQAPKVAIIAPLEVVNPAIPETVDAALVEKAVRDGQIKGCIAEGPLPFDVAVSRQAALEKGIESQVSGCVDIMLMPDLSTGNALTKSLTYYAGYPSSGNVAGTNKPVIMTSRTDTPQNKYNSILVAVCQSLVRAEQAKEPMANCLK